MMNDKGHTETPWTFNFKGDIGNAETKEGVILLEGICGKTPEQAKANGARIVKCVNAHDGLVSSLKMVTENLRALVASEVCDHSAGICWCGVRTDINEAEAVLRAVGIEVPK